MKGELWFHLHKVLPFSALPGTPANGLRIERQYAGTRLTEINLWQVQDLGGYSDGQRVS